MAGPLSGIRVIELPAIGPAPFCGMMLSDMGADVLRVERMAGTDLGVAQSRRSAILHRGRSAVGIDLKRAEGVALVKRLVKRADILIEGFRPGVMERLGLGPQECHVENPALVYGRMTGWGQEGPLANTAGHDINFIALTGVLHAIGRKGAPPTPPLNLIGDFGGGGMYLAFGVVCALLEARRSGRGDVVDAAMVDGASSLASYIYGLHADGRWSTERATNALDSGTPWYDVYETKDARFVAVGAIEDRFYAELVKRLGLAHDRLPAREDRSRWPELRQQIATAFRTRTRDEWSAIMGESDACVSPVLDWSEAPQHSHIRARSTFTDVEGDPQPSPAPRFARSGTRTPAVAPEASGEALMSWGYGVEEIEALREMRVVG